MKENGISINVSYFEEEGVKFINFLTENKAVELRKEMIKFLKESAWPDSLEYGLIMEFINDFFMYKPPGFDEE